MKGVMKFAPGVGNVEVREVAEPEPPPGCVKLAVALAGVCGTDIHIYYDEFRSWPPVILGHEVVGQVVEVGAGVTRVKPGMRATTETYFSTCGKCRFCRSGQVNLCPDRRSIGSGVNGGFTSYVIVPEINIHPLPDHVSWQAGVLTEPLACVVHAAERVKWLPGDVAVVAGPGAIGLLAIQVIKATGATVIALGAGGDEARLAMATALGADYALSVDRDDYRSLIMDVTAGYGADVVCECSGAGPAAQMLLDLVRRGGQYAQVGLFGKPVAWNLDLLCLKELSVTGSNASVPWAWTRAVDLIASGAVKTEVLVTGAYAIPDWQAAFNTFKERTGLKTVLQPES